MLKVFQIEKTQDFIQYQIKNINRLSIVTPNPQVADLVRNQFYKLGSEVETLTISKFIKDELNHLEIAEILENYKGKSELTLLLGAIWKKIGREPSVTKFNKAFNLLTEFRSFSLSDQVLETVLDEYDEQLKESVLWFHRFLNELEIVDEHKSYFLLSEKLRTADINPSYPQDRQIVFYGFDHLAASQIDLLKSLALRNDIHIPIYKDVFKKSQGLDWVNWFDEHNLTVEDISSPVIESKKLNLSTYPKGYLAKVLKQNSSKIKNILLGTKDMTREYIQEVSLEHLNFKVAVDIFEEEFSESINEIHQYFTVEEISVEWLRDKLSEYLKSCIETEKYRLFKCYSVILNKVNEWESLSDENLSLNGFDFNIITQSAKLDLPRTNLTNIDLKNTGNIKNLKNIDEFKSNEVTIVLSSEYLSLNAGSSKFTENVEKYLASIGPLRRSEFEFNTIKARFKELVDDNDVSLCVEEGLLEHDTGWSDILESYELNKIYTELDFSQSQFINRLTSSPVSLETISASKLQKYIECPQLYYQQYGLKQSPMIELPSELSVMDLGQMEHKVIEKYFDKNSSYDEKTHRKLVDFYLTHWSQNRMIPEYLKNEYFVEIFSYTQSTIKLLFELSSELQLKPTFELDFGISKDDLLYRGSVDCFLKNDSTNSKIILDFKRSNSVFTSYKSILEYDQIQLWFYISRLFEKELVKLTDQLAIGYVDLSNQENSMVFVNDEELANELKSKFGFKKVSLFEDFSEQLKAYQEFEEQKIQSLKVDSAFVPNPKDISSCHFCAIKNVCPKEAYGDS